VAVPTVNVAGVVEMVLGNSLKYFLSFSTIKNAILHGSTVLACRVCSIFSCKNFISCSVRTYKNSWLQALPGSKNPNSGNSGLF
jgi:hypothetical protein